ncbi:MAG TPA: hypothetical protein VH877_16695 [Polyangia bacterium]|jgi:hypothetical protein|nr:hypothetical protein [Polyangia bacterium]
MGFVLLILGLGGTVWGTVTATTRRRPLDLVGALAAAVGVLLAAMGALDLLVAGFLAG